MPNLLKLNLQFFSEENNEEEEEKKGDDRPAWVNEILEALKPKEEAPGAAAQVPVPPAPQTEEEEEDDHQEPQESPVKKILNFLW